MRLLFLLSKMAWAVYQGRPRGTYKWQFPLSPPAGFRTYSPSDVALSLNPFFSLPPPPSRNMARNRAAQLCCLFSFNLLKLSLGRRRGESKPDGCSWSRSLLLRRSNLVGATIALQGKGWNKSSGKRFPEDWPPLSSDHIHVKRNLFSFNSPKHYQPGVKTDFNFGGRGEG